MTIDSILIILPSLRRYSYGKVYALIMGRQDPLPQSPRIY